MPEAGKDVAANGFSLKYFVNGRWAQTRFCNKFCDSDLRPSLSIGGTCNTHFALGLQQMNAGF